MKKLAIITLSFSILFISHTFAQGTQPIGPVAKNHTHRIGNTQSTKSISVTQYEKETGALAKNKHSKKEEAKMYSVVSVKRSNIMGPKAKNANSFASTKQHDALTLGIKE